MVCPNCGSLCVDIKCKVVCPKCHTIVETCCGSQLTVNDILKER